jgi:hypothetical protein
MPVLTNTSDPSVQASFTYEEAKAAVESGAWALPEGQGLPVQDAVTGRQTEVPVAELQRLAPEAYTAGDDLARFRGSLAAAEKDAYSGVGDQLLGAAEGAASVLTMSGSDWLLDQAGADTALRAKHTAGRKVGEVAALVGTALSPFGKGGIAKALVSTPAGAVSKFGMGGKTALARIAHTAGEGTAYGLAQASTNLALAEPGVAAEQWASELGQGALLGFALGGVAGGIGVGASKLGAARAARRGALDLDSGAGKEAIEAMAKAHNSIDEMVDFAQAEGKRNVAEIRKAMRQVDKQVPHTGAVHTDIDVKFATSMDDAVKAARPPAVNRYKARAALDLLPDEKIGPEAFKRLIRLGEKNPAELVKRARILDDHYAASQAAAGGHEVAAVRVTEAMAAHKEALSRLIPAETQKLLSDPKVLGTILGVEAGIELLPEGTPGKRLLQLAAAYKLVGGIGGLRGASQSTFKRIANSIGRRASAGLAAGTARGLPAVRAAGPALGTAAMGASASAGYEMYNWAQRTFFGGAKSAMAAEAAASKGIAAADDRGGPGSPTKARGMPATSLILDKMLGEPEASKKTAPEKFKVIQDRLSKYSVAPDAVGESLYHLLKPVAEISEQLADMMEGILGVQLSYLQSKMPQDPGTMMMFGKSIWQPTDRDLYEFSMHAMGVLMPLDTVDLIADGLVPPQAAEALAATNPEIFTKMQMGIMERADEVRENSTYNQRIALGLAFQLPLDPTTDPRYVAFQQSMHAQKTMEQAAGSSGEGSTPEESYSDAQKLLS